MKKNLTAVYISAAVLILLFAYMILRPGTELPKSTTNENSNSGVADSIANTNGSGSLDIDSKISLTVESPKENEELSSSISIKGKTAVSLNSINYILTDSYESTLAQGQGKIKPDGTFSFEANLEKTIALNGTLEIYEVSRLDGKKSNIIKINIKFKQDIKK